MQISVRNLCILCVIVILLISSCSNINKDDSETILDYYAQTMRSFNREDLHGVMKFMSKGFTSDIENQQSYDKVQEFRKLLFLNNRNVEVDYININIEVEKSDATASYEVNLQTNRRRDRWSQKDSLHKHWGKWEIVSSVIIKDF